MRQHAFMTMYGVSQYKHVHVFYFEFYIVDLSGRLISGHESRTSIPLNSSMHVVEIIGLFESVNHNEKETRFEKPNSTCIGKKIEAMKRDGEDENWSLKAKRLDDTVNYMGNDLPPLEDEPRRPVHPTEVMINDKEAITAPAMLTP